VPLRVLAAMADPERTARAATEAIILIIFYILISISIYEAISSHCLDTPDIGTSAPAKKAPVFDQTVHQK
jgi:hypothetical protein